MNTQVDPACALLSGIRACHPDPRLVEFFITPEMSITSINTFANSDPDLPIELVKWVKVNLVLVSRGER
jgi:hypothetical protein